MKRIVLASRPQGEPAPSNFRLEEVATPEPGDGQILVEVSHLSLDPYMRGRMDDVVSYTDPQALDETMGGGAVGRVLVSRCDGYGEGDWVVGPFGWATHGVASGRHCRRVDPEVAPVSTALGVLGMPGFTAWAGLQAYGRMQEGETLVVGAATGPVGSLVGQLAGLRGLRTVAVAGGEEKNRLAIDTFGFDAAVDHRAHQGPRAMRAALAAACPDGVDVYFENVGGDTLGGVLPLMNLHGRIIVCGMVAWYNGGSDPTATMDLSRLWRRVLVKRLTVQGLLQTDHVRRYPEFLAEVGPMVSSGRVAWLEDVTEGLDRAPEAFIAMLKGGNQGKAVVRVS